METPEFLVWALEQNCPIRGFQNGSHPERTERQLRAARAVSDARRDKRALEGFCLDPPNGFRIADALAVYGGLSAVEQTCCGCAANANALQYRASLAGCFGMVAFSSELAPALEAALGESESIKGFHELFLVTHPRRYGLWTNSPPNMQQCQFLQAVLRRARDTCDVTELDELCRALVAAVGRQLLLHVAYFPAGRVEGTSWILAPHCQRCKAPWSSMTLRNCGVCGYRGSPVPDKKRKARGSRPYFPLDRLLGEAAAAELLLRYEVFQEQRESSQPAQRQLPLTQPDNLPAD
jgi:hypothetical protein